MSLRSRLGRPLRREIAAVDRAMVRAETRAVLAQDPIIVFSMGKTGTTSITEAVAEAAGRPVLKAHALTRPGIDERLAKAARLGLNPRPRFLWACEEIARAMRAGGRYDVLCGVRDPIAFAVSDHFYGLQRQRETGLDPWVTDDDVAGHADAIAATLETTFLDQDWFADELLEVTGIDVYALRFPTARGYENYGVGRFRALVIRSEDLSRVGATAVADHLNLAAPLRIDRHNRGTSDDDASPYRRFVESGALPHPLVEAVYATRLARHFYTDAERTDFLARWTGVLA